MTPHPVAVPPDEALGVVWKTMTDRRFRHMPVVDAEGRLLGIVSQRDLLASARARGQSLDFTDERPVSSVMHARIDTVEPECCAAEAARHMLRTKRSCLPVVDGAGVLVGILTEADYLRMATRGAPRCTCGGVTSG
jgi:CBS domain-containing protein